MQPPSQVERGSLFASLLQQSPSLNSSLASEVQQEPERLLSQMDSRFEEHEQRQSELQYYINLLLSRPHGSTSSTHGSPPQLQNQEVSPAQELTPPRREHPPAFSKTTIPAAEAHATSQPTASVHENSAMLSPQQVGEISRLLGLYHGNGQAERDTSDQPARQLFSYLQDLQTRNDELHALPTQDKPQTPSPKQNKPKTTASAAAKGKPRLQETHVIHIPTGAEKNEASHQKAQTAKAKKSTKLPTAAASSSQPTKKTEQKKTGVWK